MNHMYKAIDVGNGIKFENIALPEITKQVRKLLKLRHGNLIRSALLEDGIYVAEGYGRKANNKDMYYRFEITIERYERQYVIVHTRNGYMCYREGMTFGFTQNIAEATVFTNFVQVKTLCDMCMASAWMSEVPEGKYRPYYTPHNKFDGGIQNK